MPHEVETMAFYGKTPWHGLGCQLADDDLYNWESACLKSGLDWTADLVPLVTGDTHTEVDHRAVRRNTDGRVLGVVGPRYEVLQNRDAFRWFEPFLTSKEAALHTAGSLREGSRIWVLAKLNRDPIVVAAGDEVEKYLLLSHSHDGSLAVRVGFSPVRVVCANTLALAHGAEASKLIRVRHTREVHQNLASIREVMNIANQQFEATSEQYKLLARKSINPADLTRYVRRVLKVEEDQPSTRSTNVLAEIERLFEAGRGNDLPSVRGTWWTAYNGITEWLSYQRGHTQDSRLNSLWYGDSAALNRLALQTALEMAV